MLQDPLPDVAYKWLIMFCKPVWTFQFFDPTWRQTKKKKWWNIWSVDPSYLVFRTSEDTQVTYPWKSSRISNELSMASSAFCFVYLKVSLFKPKNFSNLCSSSSFHMSTSWTWKVNVYLELHIVIADIVTQVVLLIYQYVVICPYQKNVLHKIQWIVMITNPNCPSFIA